MNKPVAKITPNGFVKFYNADGTPNAAHDKSFCRTEDIKKLEKDYRIVYA